MTNIVGNFIIGYFVVTCPVDTNHVYQFQKSCDLISWSDVGDSVVWSKPTFDFVDYTPTNPNCFYRIRSIHL